MKFHVRELSVSSKLALPNTSYDINVKNVEQKLHYVVEGCLRAGI